VGQEGVVEIRGTRGSVSVKVKKDISSTEKIEEDG
jgi:hypothetical protein